MKTMMTRILGGAALAALAVPAAAETFTLRIGSGHPNGPAIYVTDTANFFVPEVVRRVAEETEHEIEFVEGYGGAIAGVAETLEALQADPFDIVFLDVIMDGGGAITAVHSVRAFKPDIPVVVITGRPELIDSPLFTQGLRSADAKIRKTSTLSELAEVVRVLTKG